MEVGEFRKSLTLSAFTVSRSGRFIVRRSLTRGRSVRFTGVTVRRSSVDGSTSLTLTPWCGRSKFDGSRGLLMQVLPFSTHLRTVVSRRGDKFHAVPVGRVLLGSGLRVWTLPGVLGGTVAGGALTGNRSRRRRGALIICKGRDL